MCGIAGYIQKTRHTLKPSVLKAMEHALTHRGPDDHGFLVWNGMDKPLLGHTVPDTHDSVVGFAHRRLSIIDLSPGGWQPMISHDGKCSLVFNGEIYNYIELREELIREGYTFKSQSDSEVLLAGYHCWGKAVLQKLVGMFAFAILNQETRTVFLARDFFGIKPLYYASTPNQIVFASEIKALLTCPGISRRVAVDSVYQYVRFGMCDHTDKTFFADVMQLPPAHYLEVSIDDLKIEGPIRYWSLPNQRDQDLNPVFIKEKLRDLFLDSVNLHMRSDVPVGAALSGGIDSSAIVMAMRHIAGDKANIHTFTYTAEDPAINEERYSNIVGKSSQATMHKIALNTKTLLSDLDQLLMAQEQPFGSTSIYAQYQVFAKAKAEGIKVMLDGQGADEMLAGYKTYNPARAVSLLRNGEIIDAIKLLKQTGTFSGGKSVNNLLKLMTGLIPAGISRRIVSPLASRLLPSPQWLNLKWVEQHGDVRNFSFTRGLQSVSDLLHLTFTSTSLPSLLRYEDCNSMIHSIESRVPFLTPQLVSFIFTLPEQYLIDNSGTSKSIFREAMRGLVPDTILDRRDKIGFATPEHLWVKDLKPWISQLINSDTARSIPILDCKAMEIEYHNVLEGKKSFDWRIWRWINLIRWSELFEVEYH
jgi:asparagine synthase (glutamine-hydrolysing)